MVEEKRQFNRVKFKTIASFIVGSQSIECRIIDISLKGVLLQRLSNVEVELGVGYKLIIPLTDSDQKITMALELVNQREEQLGLMCTHIDLDSITHLRNLVELNLGDSELLERDFEALVNDVIE